MIGRRSAALLCVLLAHAWLIVALLRYQAAEPRTALRDEFETAPITLYLLPLLPETDEPAPPPVASPDQVDWPLEGKKAATRVLAREAEAERLARMFAGPGGTWASLTKRQRSKLNKFRWKKGVLGLEYDSQGNQIYHISEGCVIVNSMFFGCAIGKPKVHDDMFDNMRQYFDEQRLPETNEGNGTEPEALRPAN
jgi:hypothetical protein